MKSSIFSTLIGYVKDLFLGARSIVSSSWTAVPYLFGAGEWRKEVTEQYPDPVSSRTGDDLPPKSRGLLFNDIEKCTGCKDCERACPVQCIRIETETEPEPNKTWVAVYEIDFGKCIYCGICADVCQPGSLVHTKDYEMAQFSKDQMKANFGRGTVSVELREKWARLRKSEEFLW